MALLNNMLKVPPWLFMASLCTSSENWLISHYVDRLQGVDIPSHPEGHHGCSQVWALKNKDAVTSVCRFWCKYKFSTHLCQIRRSSIAGSCCKNVLCPETWPEFFQVAAASSILTSHGWEFLLLHVLTCIWWSQCSGLGHSNMCGEACHCHFNLSFSDDKWWWILFHMLICIYMPALMVH